MLKVGWRGMSLAVLASALEGWAALIMLAVWGVRVAIARATEASDLKTSKVSFKHLTPEQTFSQRCRFYEAAIIGL